MKSKITIWLKRYVPAEFFAAIGALSFGIGINTLFHNPLFTALAGTVGDNCGYYGTIVINDLRKQKEKHQKITFPIFVKTAKGIIFEFGIAEFLDSFFVRPFSMYLFPLLLNNVGFGLLVGKITADVIFYIPTIIAYELKTKLENKK